MTDRDIARPIDVTPQSMISREAADLTKPVDELRVEPDGWAEAWKIEAQRMREEASRPRVGTLTKIGQSATFRVERRGKK